MQKNRQRKLARIAGLREPEPYLEPRKQKQHTEAAAAAAAALSARDFVAGEASQEGAVGANGEEMSNMVVPGPDSPYADLGGVEPESLISFAYQIATGMVSCVFLHFSLTYTIS